MAGSASRIIKIHRQRGRVKYTRRTLIFAGTLQTSIHGNFEFIGMIQIFCGLKSPHISSIPSSPRKGSQGGPLLVWLPLNRQSGGLPDDKPFLRGVAGRLFVSVLWILRRTSTFNHCLCFRKIPPQPSDARHSSGPPGTL